MGQKNNMQLPYTTSGYIITKTKSPESLITNDPRVFILTRILVNYESLNFLSPACV